MYMYLLVKKDEAGQKGWSKRIRVKFANKPTFLTKTAILYRIKYSNETSSGIFNGIAFGVNVYLRAHIDNDFTYSVIQVHTDCTEYKIEDDVVCYFCFPRLGIAVGLKPGDFLLVNALEYHCLSSRCYTDVDLFCVSSYLKTAVVGGNDNKRKLSEREMACLNTVPNKKGKK